MVVGVVYFRRRLSHLTPRPTLGSARAMRDSTSTKQNRLLKVRLCCFSQERHGVCVCGYLKLKIWAPPVGLEPGLVSVAFRIEGAWSIAGGLGSIPLGYCIVSGWSLRGALILVVVLERCHVFAFDYCYCCLIETTVLCLRGFASVYHV